MDKVCCKKFWHFSNQLEHPTYYYFDNSTKLLSDLHISK